MDWVREVDTAIFLALNGTLRTAWLDSFFMFLSYPPMRVLFFVTAWITLIALGGRRGLWGGMALLIAVCATDQIAAGILKPWVDRVRPCFVIPETILLVPHQARSPSFPSNHAANAFAAAVLISWILRGRGRWAYILAALVALSRVYLGVHYPLDIAAGALLGLLIGVLARRAAAWFWDRTASRECTRTADRVRCPIPPAS